MVHVGQAGRVTITFPDGTVQEMGCDWKVEAECPYSLLYEFDQWWAWQRLVCFEGVDPIDAWRIVESGRSIWDMGKVPMEATLVRYPEPQNIEFKVMPK